MSAWTQPGAISRERRESKRCDGRRRKRRKRRKRSEDYCSLYVQTVLGLYEEPEGFMISVRTSI